ncbi:Cis-toluene dihydrodiol dehydrogenase [bacterium HR27]|nr:Cis-toluene dihydrodiol dehydrogenase [bacterium HR27]
MAGRLEGKVAVVTGAGSGIGKAITERFVREGARVVACDLHGERVEALARELGNAVVPVQADVTSFEANQRAVATAVERFGRLDVFFGNAGVFDGFLALYQYQSADLLSQMFDRVFNVNVKAYLLGAYAAYPELLKTRGTLLYTASTAGFYTNQGGIIYTATKHAVVGLIRELAYEFAPKIRVNGIAPGGTFTDLRNALAIGAEFGDPDKRSLFDMPGLDDFIKQSTPLRRVNSSEDHAAVAAFLASDDAAGLTGVIIHCDGGYGIRGAVAAAGGDNL